MVLLRLCRNNTIQSTSNIPDLVLCHEFGQRVDKGLILRVGAERNPNHIRDAPSAQGCHGESTCAQRRRWSVHRREPE
jgi:hypothetical protein